jgi:hypothetical protein
MRGRMFLFAVALAGLMFPLASAQAQFRIGIGIGIPIGPYYGPYYRPYYYPPVVVTPAPLVVQPAPAYVTVPASVYSPYLPPTAPAQGPAIAPAPRVVPQ